MTRPKDVPWWDSDGFMIGVWLPAALFAGGYGTYAWGRLLGWW